MKIILRDFKTFVETLQCNVSTPQIHPFNQQRQILGIFSHLQMSFAISKELKFLAEHDFYVDYFGTNFNVPALLAVSMGWYSILRQGSTISL